MKLMKLLKIEKIESKVCFDIEVENTNCFFANCILVHNSNGGVRVNNGDVRPQSREQLLSMQSDNAGFYSFCHPKFDVFRNMAEKIGSDDITIFGEWCGGNIQKSVALNQLPKHFVIFNVWNSKAGDEGGYIGLDKLQYTDDELKALNDQEIWFINQIPDYEIDIDFNDPQKGADIITEMTLKVEETCPWGAFRGVNGIGEGIVWQAVNRQFDSGLWFKSKGVLHKGAAGRKEKVYKKLSATPEHVEGVNTLLDLLLPTWRLDQGYDYISDVAGGQPTNKHTGDFLKWIHADVLKEETDRITANGLTWKDVAGAVSKRAKNYLFMRIGNFDSVENDVE